jgi:NAD(P)-dependent dehydrogenase (short-subunit alcohol dehydrogenase family)
MELGLAGKNALVTGASKGIGLAITRALAAEGAHVVAGARGGSPELEELSGGGQVRSVKVDLSTATGPDELVVDAREDGPIDVLVNNVGAVVPRTDGFLEVTDEQWLGSLNLTFMAAVRTTRAVLPDMLAAGRGTIVTTCSVNAFLPDPAVIDYSAAKAALLNFSKSLSKEVGPRGIRVNTVSPGPVSTGLWLGDDGVAATVARAQGGGDPTAVAREAAGGTATGRFSEPTEVADLVVLLASDRAGNVTGADFVIDGGLIQTL